MARCTRHDPWFEFERKKLRKNKVKCLTLILFATVTVVPSECRGVVAEL